MNLESLIDSAIQEDLPEGDLTTQSLGIKTRPGRARLLAKEDLILSGTDVFEAVVKRFDPEGHINWHFKDGELVLSGQTMASLSGDLVALIKAERTALNFLGRLSGIATYTRCFVQAIESYKCSILDTRKTTPGYRYLEKRAVRHGGGLNHRMDLSSAILIKENHIALAGGITKAIQSIRKNTNADIEVETRTLEEVREAVSNGVQRILLDNMSVETMAQALEIIPSAIATEASGNMTLERVKEVAALGVNFISVGAITHSAPTADLSLLFDWDFNPVGDVL